MVILVRGTKDSSSENYADRILAAVATYTFTKYGRKTIVLQATSSFAVENVLMGKMTRESGIRTNEYNFEDTGMDALFRRIAIGPLSNEQFSDCCLNIAAKQMNGFDVAKVSKTENIAEFMATNEGTTKELLKNANSIYDVVYILVRGCDTKLIKVLKNTGLIDREVVCIPQGPCKESPSDPNVFYAVKNYDRLSMFTIKAIGQSYKSKNVYPIPYNVMFKDACLNENAVLYLQQNVEPDPVDDNAYFSECITQFVGSLTNLSEPVIRERSFTFKR